MHLGPRSWPQQQQPQPQQQHVQHSVEGPEAPYGGPGQAFSQGPGPYGHGGAGASIYDGSRGHQGGPSGLNGTAPGPAASHPPVPRSTHTPAPSSGPNGTAAQQASGEKRGPVEFNHAISYVNKIKVSECPSSSLWTILFRPVCQSHVTFMSSGQMGFRHRRCSTPFCLSLLVYPLVSVLFIVFVG